MLATSGFPLDKRRDLMGKSALAPCATQTEGESTEISRAEEVASNGVWTDFGLE